MKKIIGFALGMLAAVAVIVAAPASVKADYLPCTQDTINQFKANKAVAEQELAQVQAVKAQADAKVAALKAQGVTGLELLQATDAATNAANMVKDYMGKVQYCQASIDNIIGRGQIENYYLNMEAKWKDRAVIDNIETQLTGARQVESAALEQLNVLKATLAGQQVQAASNPAFAANVATLQAQVAQAEANYAAKKAAADALAAQYAQQKASLNWATNADNAAYNQFVTDFINGTKVEATLIGCDGKEYKVSYWDPTKPTEWAIRWFE